MSDRRFICPSPPSVEEIREATRLSQARRRRDELDIEIDKEALYFDVEEVDGPLRFEIRVLPEWFRDGVLRAFLVSTAMEENPEIVPEHDVFVKIRVPKATGDRGPVEILELNLLAADLDDRF